MKKCLLIFLFASGICFSPAAFAQKKWLSVIDYGISAGWKMYIDGPVRVLYPDSLWDPTGGEILYFGGEFDSLIWDSSSVHHAICMGPVLSWYWNNSYYLSGGAPDCQPYPDINKVNPLRPSVFSVARFQDTMGGIWFSCAGRFNWGNCSAPAMSESYANNIMFCEGTIASSIKMGVYSFNYMDTVFAIDFSKTLWNGNCFPYMYTYIAARCVFCNGSTNNDSTRYIGFYNHCPKLTFNFMQGGTTGPVYAIKVIDTSNVYAGGLFDSAGTIKANNLAKWNGASWDSLGSGVNGVVKTLLAYNGKIYAGGNFTTAGGNAANNIAVWNGSSWSALGSGTNGTVYALTIHNGDLYAGGSFTQAGGNAASNLAHWNGTQWSDVGGGRNDEVYALASFKGDLYAGGKFSGGTNDTAKYIARYTDTTLNAQSAMLNPQSAIQISPNPTSGQFQIQVGNGQSAMGNEYKIEIYNVLGEKVTQRVIPSAARNLTIDVSSLEQGIYFLELQTGSKTMREKFVIAE
ncbi:MAG: T9SS type A sorting domain-containing protein [Bacteroidetes bacterium]|nr:T9SS type A sorting domain-containing protein [Bacteroidota bacterium]